MGAQQERIHGLLAASRAQLSVAIMNLWWHQTVRLPDILKQSLAAQVYKDIRDLGLIQAEVYQGDWEGGQWKKCSKRVEGL